MAGLPSDVERFLAAPLFGKLATLGADGSPQVTPVWYMVDGGKLIVNTSRDRVKFRNVSRDPRVCLLVDDGYSYVMVRGRARVAAERDPFRDIEAIAVRYRGEEQGRRDAKEVYSKHPRVSLEIVPEKVSRYP